LRPYEPAILGAARVDLVDYWCLDQPMRMFQEEGTGWGWGMRHCISWRMCMPFKSDYINYFCKGYSRSSKGVLD
jgi:hypothetical protein